MSAIKMLLVGDNVDFIEGLRSWLVKEPDIEILRIEHSGTAAIKCLGTIRPQIILMDVTMSGISGFEACRRIRPQKGSPTIILMAFHESETVRREAWAAGADGVVAKGQIAENLLSMVRKLAGRSAESLERSRKRIKSPEKGGPWT